MYAYIIIHIYSGSECILDTYMFYVIIFLVMDGHTLGADEVKYIEMYLNTLESI